jgi:6-phosphogluconolactonase
MEKNIKIFPSPFELAWNFAEEIVQITNESVKDNKPCTIALSGGSTPETLFTVLSKKFAGKVLWQNVHIFWGDERCVPPDDKESNFGTANKMLLNKIDIPPANIHRIIGENDPMDEAIRYSGEISTFTQKRNNLPLFDLIILGLGEDGHTASIFPGHNELFDSEHVCEVASHPVTHQKRITITGRIINNADNISFLVTGRKKAEVIKNLFKKNSTIKDYPASRVNPVYGQLNWFLDKEAAIFL